MVPLRSLDILIITALREEYDQALLVDAGAFEGSTWQIRPGPLGHDMAFRAFRAQNGQPLQVAVTWATNMGGVAAASLAERVLSAYRPRCIAMCGVCAGRRGATNIGDVIIADRVWMYDTGKLNAEYDADGKRTERVQGDVITYNLRADWKKAAEGFSTAFPELMRDLSKNRPRPIETQADWVLARLLAGESPRKHPEVKTKAPNFPQVMDLLWKMGLVRDGDVELTDLGKKRINRLLVKYDDVPEPADFQVRVGPIGTGNKVIQDPEIFNNLSENMRKVLGLEMEAMAIWAVAHEHPDDIRHAIVMKGVMDHADEWKSDAAKEFAARASAECLMAFLRAFLPPVDRFDGILDSGTADRPHAPGPSHLLHAKYQYISFYEAGRADILLRLRAFCTEPAPTGVWLIHGEGGMGKTRLMIEFVKQLRSDGWVAGFLRASADKDRFTELITSDLPVCLVIDYAESRPELASLLADVARIRVRGAPLRFVLLARNAGDWWTMLLARDSSTTALLTERAPEALAPLVESAQRIDMVKKAADEFATIIGREKPSSVLPPLHDVRFERALYLHLAALAWVEGLFFTADTLLDEILAHEERFWVTQANAMNNGLAEYAFIEKTRRAVAAMTLCGGMASQHAGELLLGRISPRFDDELLAFLRRLYPGLKGTFTTGLEPDLLGDGMVWRTMTRMREHGDLPALFLDQVFQGEPEGALVAGFTVLGRLSVEHAQEVRPWIMHVLEGDIDARALAALRATKELGTKTAYAWVGIELAGVLERLGTVELARRLEEADIPDFTVSMREVREWVTRKVLTLYSAEDQSIEVRAKRAGELNKLGVRQCELGQRKMALVSTQQAIDLFRGLASKRPATFSLNLALTLNNLAQLQATMGEHESALASIKEAVTICRQLVAQSPEKILPRLALCLNSLGEKQSDLGQRELALAATQEAVEICRKLARERPDASLGPLANCLNNLSNRQREVGQRHKAVMSAQEAVEAYRTLAERWPDRFLPDLAMGLGTLGLMQRDMGDHAAALISAQAAVEIERKLALQRPSAFLHKLAGSLNNLGLAQSDMGQSEAALASIQQSVDIRRQLADLPPDAYRGDLARSLKNLGSVQGELEQLESALTSTQEAVDIYRDIVERLPDTYLPEFAIGLVNLSAIQGLLRLHEQALTHAQEAVDIYEKLFQQYPQVFADAANDAANHLCRIQKALGIPLDTTTQERMQRLICVNHAIEE